MAESCTGGLLAQRITDIPGASAHFLGGVVTYTEDAKVRLLDMDEDLIAENGVVSMPVAAKMAKRVRKALGATSASASPAGLGPTGTTWGSCSWRSPRAVAASSAVCNAATRRGRASGSSRPATLWI